MFPFIPPIQPNSQYSAPNYFCSYVNFPLGQVLQNQNPQLFLYPPFFEEMFSQNGSFQQNKILNCQSDKQKSSFTTFEFNKNFIEKTQGKEIENRDSLSKNSRVYEKKTRRITKKPKQNSKFLLQSRNTKQKYQENIQSKESCCDLKGEKHKKQEQQLLYLKYRRKNTQSNIVNRVFSFLKTQFKNKNEFGKLALSEKTKLNYLQFLSIVEEAWRGPIKRQLLLCMAYPKEQMPGYKALRKKMEKQGSLSIVQFSRLTRVLMCLYLNKIAPISVVTSKKMKKSVWKEHLQKIRQLKQFLFSVEPQVD